MNIVYLLNGQACYFKEKIGDKFIVNKIYQYEVDEGVLEIEDKNDIVVDTIFEKPPVEKIDAEIKNLQALQKQISNDVSLLNKKKRNLQSEIENIQKTQISNEKFIINRTELLKANSLALFPKDKPMPILMDKKESFYGLKLAIEIKISDGIERQWGYKLFYDDSGYMGSEYLCEKYGVLINPTQEDIDATIKKRLQEFQFTDYWLCTVPDKYLTDEIKQKKSKYLVDKKAKEIVDLENQLETLQSKLALRKKQI